MANHQHAIHLGLDRQSYAKYSDTSPCSGQHNSSSTGLPHAGQRRTSGFLASGGFGCFIGSLLLKNHALSSLKSLCIYSSSSLMWEPLELFSGSAIGNCYSGSLPWGGTARKSEWKTRKLLLTLFCHILSVVLIVKKYVIACSRTGTLLDFDYFSLLKKDQGFDDYLSGVTRILTKVGQRWVASPGCRYSMKCDSDSQVAFSVSQMWRKPCEVF